MSPILPVPTASASPEVDQPQAAPPATRPQQSAPEGTPHSGPPPGWVPIRSLTPQHRSRIVAHLLALGERDRYLRFGYPASDEQIERYVAGMDFDRDVVFGVFNRRLEIIGLAHVAFPSAGQPMAHGAEFGGSVLAKARGKGLGGRLFEHAMLHARNHGAETLYIHALSENAPMLRIARRAGAHIERYGGESEGRLRLPPDTIASQVEEWLGRHAAEFDYSIKQGARQVDRMIGAFTGQREATAPAPSTSGAPPERDGTEDGR